MADSLEIRSLRGVDPEILTEVFNQSFADYVVPFQATREYLQFRWQLARVDWDLSLGAFDGPSLAAFCWHGIDHIDGKVVVYNAGTGVLPQYRGQALVDRIYEHSWTLFRERDAQRCTLEVIAGNDRAVRVYERIGFRARRELVLMQGDLDLARLKQGVAVVEIRQLEDPSWDHLSALETVEPAWDFMLSGARAQGDSIRVLGAFDGEDFVGAAILRDSDFTICWLSVAQNHRGMGVASAFLQEAARVSPRWRMVNVDRRASDLLGLLASVGMEEVLYQYEMERALSSVDG